MTKIGPPALEAIIYTVIFLMVEHLILDLQIVAGKAVVHAKPHTAICHISQGTREL